MNENLFDFDNHKKEAISEYTKVRPIFKAFSDVIKSIVNECVSNNTILVHSVEARAKTVESFGDKAIIPSKEDSNKPKYKNPLTEITDLAGVRVIVFFPRTLDEVDSLINNEFEILERSDKSEILEREEKLGYQSVHYLIKLKKNRSSLPEYKRYNSLIAEIQVRTILQHAWAEIEHDIQYKSVATIPKSIKRRFMALAGLLELADKEFQAIQDEDFHIRKMDVESVQEGDFKVANINQNTLKTYLDNRFGQDRHMTDFSYSWEAEQLIRMGFKDFTEIDDYLKGIDDDCISRTLWGTRQGQLTRFEDALMTGMGYEFVERHPWGSESWFRERNNKNLKLLKSKGLLKSGEKINRGKVS